MSRFSRKAAVCLVLAALTIIAFWPLKDNAFINFDDNLYITENLQVQGGLSGPGLVWAFSTTAAGNWHPLTWLSHMLDWQLFGADPRGHHLIGLMLHLVNALLLFLVWAGLTRKLWPAALVAALFALHPLHVESVAWASERKDLLSACFWLTTMWAYMWYAARPGAWRYLLVLLSFALGLLAKPMVVTEPFVLLLLDYWPLGRWPGGPAAARCEGESAPGTAPLPTSSQLLWEKAPLFGLAAISCFITFAAQKVALASAAALPVWLRLSNALAAYVGYLGQTFWPRHLAVFYPYPAYGANGLPGWQIVGSGLILVGLTILVLRWGRRFPYLPVGWFWYLGTLVPVIGLVQVGEQAMADRYTYLPLIGIFLILAYGAADLAAGRRRRQAVLGAAFGLALLACLLLTRLQVGYWRDSETLFAQAAAVTENNFAAYNNLGLAYDQAGRHEEAIAMYYRAIRANPKLADAYNNLGVGLAGRGEVSAAIPMFQQAIRLRPDLDRPYHNLGVAYWRQGRIKEAREMFESALKINPDNTAAREMLATLQGR